MVFSSVLRRTSLTTHFIHGRVGTTASSSQHRLAHSFYHHVVVLFLHLGLVLYLETVGDVSTFYLLDDVRCDIISAIRNGCAQIGYLEWRECHLSLSDGNGDDAKRIPLTQSAVVVIGIRNHATHFTREVDAQLIAKSH